MIGDPPPPFNHFYLITDRASARELLDLGLSADKRTKSTETTQQAYRVTRRLPPFSDVVSLERILKSIRAGGLSRGKGNLEVNDSEEWLALSVPHQFPETWKKDREEWLVPHSYIRDHGKLGRHTSEHDRLVLSPVSPLPRVPRAYPGTPRDYFGGWYWKMAEKSLTSPGGRTDDYASAFAGCLWIAGAIAMSLLIVIQGWQYLSDFDHRVPGAINELAALVVWAIGIYLFVPIRIPGGWKK